MLKQMSLIKRAELSSKRCAILSFRGSQRNISPAIVLSILTAGMSTSYAAAAPGPDTAARIGQVCRETMGLEPGEAQYDFCVGTLSSQMQGRRQAYALVAARRSCLDRGMLAGSSALAQCELQTSENVPIGASLDASPAEVPRATSSFFRTTPDEAFHRAQASCAALGFDPIDDAFSSCVANLNASMQGETPEG